MKRAFPRRQSATENPTQSKIACGPRVAPRASWLGPPKATPQRRRRGAGAVPWALGFTLGVALTPRPAAAQATSWMYLGGGSGSLKSDEARTRGLVQIDAGLGVPADRAIVWGALFRLQPYWDSGIDLGLVGRAVTRGYARGEFGLGLDVGVMQRWWGESSTSLTANLVLGGPWGIAVNGGVSYGGEQSQTLFATIGIDFARLTVHRHSGLNWFQNPMRSPEPSPQEQALAGP